MPITLDIPKQYQGVGMTSQRTRNRMVNALQELGVDDEDVLSVMKQLPRHLFVDEAMATRAYEDTWLPIGQRQTISRPYTVALMTQHLLAASDNRDTVLEIGTGSGYQTAVLSCLFKRVYSVERIALLQARARGILKKLNLTNVHYHLSDGSWGWESFAPYRSIIVTAAPEEVPQALVAQLDTHSAMMIPVGTSEQHLMKVAKYDTDKITVEEIEAARFVPLVTEEQ